MVVPEKAVRLVCAVVMVLGGSAVRGHDIWLEADAVAAGATAKPEERALHLRLGEKFVAEEEKPLSKEVVSRFDVLADRVGRRDLLAAAQDGQTPAGKLPTGLSVCLVVMDRKSRQITLEAEKFSSYLAEEGLETVLAQRARLGQSGEEGHESYSRYLKVLVPSGTESDSLPNTLYKRRVGQRLEILFQNDPGRLMIDRKLTAKVLFEGKPLAGVKVFAYRHEATATTAPPGVVTDTQGLAKFVLDQDGAWLVRLVYMRASPERRTDPNGAWESFWGAYSFVAKGTSGEKSR